MELTSKTGRMLSLTADGMLGSKLGLGDIPYEKMGEKEFEDATRTLFTALFGKDAVKAVDVNAVYDEHYCTMDPKMADGSEYEIQYRDGMIMDVSSFFKTDPSTWPSVPEWLKEERLERFMETQAGISAARLARKIGTRQMVIVDEVDEDGAVARSKADAPEIDGIVRTDDGQKLKPGQFAEVEIVHADEHDLIGRLGPAAH